MGFRQELASGKMLIEKLTNAVAVQGLSGMAEARLKSLLNNAKEALTNAEQLMAEEMGKDSENATKLRLWERKLLDLSLRNNLLNMRLGKNAFPFEAKDIAELEDELDMGKEFMLEQKELKGRNSESHKACLDGRVVTELDKVKGIYRAVRTNLEESGVNTLFLTLGTLHWNEHEGGRVYAAPILLVPVDMVPVKKQGYAIRKRDEDVMLNATLMELLKQQFDINVEGVSPLPQDAHGIDVSLVLHEVREAVKEQSGWEVVEDSVLGIFSFSKFVMWNDIHRHGAAVMENPIIRSLVEGRLMMEADAEPVDARTMDVNTRPDALAVPVDADSSQLEAMVESEQGRSFILYGPPGTGKSQTITNLIANAVYHGKRVLFVAEKKAALDVVQSRLAKIGLAPFCLELHSNKMDKRHFLQQMQMSIEAIGKQPTEDYQRVANALYDQRLQLVGYVNALHQKHKNGLSLHDCIERVLTTKAEPLTLPKGFTTGMTLEQAEAYCNRILALASSVELLGVPLGEHPLRDLLPKPRPAKKQTAYVSALSLGFTLEQQLPQLPQFIAGVKAQIERNKKMSFISKTTRQYVEGDYRLKKFLALADVSEALLNDIDAFAAAAERWNANISLLPQWQQFTDQLSQLSSEGLEDAVAQFQNGIPPELIRDAFMAAFYQQMAFAFISEDSILAHFSGMLFEQVIARYNELTSQFQQLTRQELVARLSARVPVDTREPELSSELTLLRKRIGNKGRGTSIRGIIDQMPELLPRLCPVMLMSPLSVAQFIDINGPKFDIVVFDEASQMPTSEAVGAICRGKATIVVGDPKQMPPTNFFTVSTTDEDEAESDDLESILDDCIALSMPARYLGWHYRSKHESLIAFSNQKFYDGKLITFPSADDMMSHVTWQHVDGFYDYGKTRTNRAEAEAIVAEAITRMQTTPKYSIGIVAFSKQQSDLIEDILNEQLSLHPNLEQQNMESEEPLFVKNLENVQGDERDVILFSIGYGPDKDGKVSMNFGPLNKAGGERRLNVAVTRARYEMKVFSTLLPEQIDERRTQAEGVLGLKRFLCFAQNNETVNAIRASEQSKDQPIVTQLAKALRGKGYDVHTNVGTSSFKIDIAIVDPTNKERYLLDIICDGQNYYQLKTARDREVVRPAVLKRLGWELTHVWATDWLLHPDIVLDHILNQLKTPIMTKR